MDTEEASEDFAQVQKRPGSASLEQVVQAIGWKPLLKIRLEHVARVKLVDYLSRFFSGIYELKYFQVYFINIVLLMQHYLLDPVQKSLPKFASYQNHWKAADLISLNERDGFEE